MLRLAFGTAGLLLCLIASAQTAAPIAVGVQTLEQVALPDWGTAPANVLPRNDSRLAAEVTAQVARIRAEVGEAVKAGQLLVELDATDYRLALAQADAQVSAAQARVALAEQRLRQGLMLKARQFVSDDAVLELNTGVQAAQADNHPLANIAFAVMILMGLLSYDRMPREQDPEINFNWVNISTVLPGASAEDVEKRVTNPLEDSIRGVQDVKFVVSSTREGVSNILVRFRDIPLRVFDKRVNDLRREIQIKANAELPVETLDPEILEITTSNGFPTAMVVLTGQAEGWSAAACN